MKKLFVFTALVFLFNCDNPGSVPVDVAFVADFRTAVEKGDEEKFKQALLPKSENTPRLYTVNDGKTADRRKVATSRKELAAFLKGKSLLPTRVNRLRRDDLHSRTPIMRDGDGAVSTEYTATELTFYAEDRTNIVKVIVWTAYSQGTFNSQEAADLYNNGNRQYSSSKFYIGDVTLYGAEVPQD